MYKDIPNYKGRYAITKDGRIWSYKKGNTHRHNGKWLKGKSKVGHGYYHLGLSNNGKVEQFLVHRLVAMTYIPNPHKYPQVNHLNGKITDNRVENLEWCNNSMNMAHAVRTGLYDLKGSKHPNSKLTESKVKSIRSIYAKHFIPYLITARKYKVASTLIGQIVRKEIWTHI